MSEGWNCTLIGKQPQYNSLYGVNVVLTGKFIWCQQQTFILLVHLFSYPHICSWDMGNNQIIQTSAWVSSLGWLGSALEIEWGARSRAAALPCLKERLCIWFGCILVASLYLKVDPEPAGEIIYLVWPGNISWSPRSTLNVFLISRITRITCLACCHSKSSGKRLWRSQWKHADTEKNNLRQSITFYFTETVNFRNAICIYLFER